MRRGSKMWHSQRRIVSCERSNGHINKAEKAKNWEYEVERTRGDVLNGDRKTDKNKYKIVCSEQ